MNEFAGETVPLGDMRHPTLQRAYDYWHTRKGDRAFPSRTDISPEDMKSFLRRVLLVDVFYEPFDLVYRVFGSGIAAAHNKDYTGKSVRALEPPAFAEVVWQQYADVIERRVPLLHEVLLSTQDHYLRYQRLTLPLSSNCVTIDKLLAVSIEDRGFWEAVYRT